MCDPAPGLEIDVFADIVCPWCFIGTERLERVLAGLGMSESVQVLHRPFFLDPSTPASGRNVPEYLRRKYGVDPRPLFARAEAAARESGLELDLTKQAWSYPTVHPHTLLRHAGPKGTQRALARALYRAYFQDALNVSDVAVLASIAVPHGFSPDEVASILSDESELEATRRDASEALRLGIRGVPFFVLGGRSALSGAQPENVFREALLRASSP